MSQLNLAEVLGETFNILSPNLETLQIFCGIMSGEKKGELIMEEIKKETEEIIIGPEKPDYH